MSQAKKVSKTKSRRTTANPTGTSVRKNCNGPAPKKKRGEAASLGVTPAVPVDARPSAPHAMERVMQLSLLLAEMYEAGTGLMETIRDFSQRGSSIRGLHSVVEHLERFRSQANVIVGDVAPLFDDRNTAPGNRWGAKTAHSVRSAYDEISQMILASSAFEDQKRLHSELSRNVGQWDNRIMADMDALKEISDQLFDFAKLEASKKTALGWEEVAKRLTRLCEAGEQYTSQGELAKRLGTSQATISKAINRSSKLLGWSEPKRKTAPSATGLNEVVAANAIQTTEPNPSEVLPGDDVDATLARLLDLAEPKERARINAMSADERRELAVQFRDCEQDYEPSPAKDDPDGDKPLKVKQHKHA